MPVLTGHLWPDGEAVVTVEVAAPGRGSRLAPAAPARVQAVIDTGASASCIDPRVVLALNLSPFTTRPIQTASSGQTTVHCDVYRVRWTVLHPGPGAHLTIPSLEVIATDLDQTGPEALLGCDVLARCEFTYNGRAGTFSLAW